MTKVVLLDGGMGQELLHRSGATPTPLWSAQVMDDQPDAVEAVHLDYIEAGARVITVNAYSATRARLRQAGREADFERLQRRACELAVAAREASGADVAIAGCLSPYRWSYRPELAPPFEQLWPEYQETAELQAPYVDLFLCETMGSAEEARSAVAGAMATGKPVWVSWTLADDDRGVLRSGDSVIAADAALPDGVAARLVNCTTPEAVSAAMPELVTLGGPVGAYANGFAGIRGDFAPDTTTAALAARDDLTPPRYADLALGWIEIGASIVGGCCEIGPAHIAELRRRLDDAGHEIVRP